MNSSAPEGPAGKAMLDRIVADPSLLQTIFLKLHPDGSLVIEFNVPPGKPPNTKGFITLDPLTALDSARQIVRAYEEKHPPIKAVRAPARKGPRLPEGLLMGVYIGLIIFGLWLLQ